MFEAFTPAHAQTFLGGLFGLLMVAGAVAMFAQSVVGAGLPGGRAGLDTLLGRIKCTSAVTGANADTNITLTGVALGDSILTVIASDGTDLGAAVVTVTAANTIQIDTSTASKELTVIWIASTSAAPSQGTEYDPEWGVLDTLLGTKLRVDVIAGANGALTLTGLATTDTVLGLFQTDAALDLSGSVWAVTTNTLTPTPSLDTSSDHVVVIWIDESASSGGNGNDWNSSYGSMRAGTLTAILSGLRCSAGTGPVVSNLELVSGSFANIVAVDNLVAVWGDTSATDPLADGAWSTKAGGLARVGTAALNALKIHALWIDHSATGLVAA